MPRRRTSASPLLARSLAIAVDAPQVVSHRLARMALAGPVLSARDRREFHQMGQEKWAAFFESWTAMWVECVRQSVALWSAPLLFAAPGAAGRRRRQVHSAAMSVMSRGLGPVQRRASANARRLARTPLR